MLCLSLILMAAAALLSLEGVLAWRERRQRQARPERDPHNAAHLWRNLADVDQALTDAAIRKAMLERGLQAYPPRHARHVAFNAKRIKWLDHPRHANN